MLLGAIADDLTGATDIALAFSRNGFRTLQINGVPDGDISGSDADAVVVALKSRTSPADEAVRESRAAAAWLIGQGARQIIFKYCSTFDSTDEGNIGPVTEALLDELGEEITIAAPSFPQNGRSVVHGHLFVGSQLLSESSMKDHPLTPMRDSNIERVLQRQTRLKVGRLPHATVSGEVSSIVNEVKNAIDSGVRILVADALYGSDLTNLAEALQNRKLLTGAAGIGDAAARVWASQLPLREPFEISWPSGEAVILAGSCSTMTRRQIEHLLALGYPALKVQPEELMSGRQTSEAATAWAIAQTSGTPVIYSSTDPAEVAALQTRIGKKQASELVESFFGDVARRLRDHGFRKIMVAGGETSGAVVQGLGGRVLRVGPEIDPGVPWTLLSGDPETALALKSGNFGSTDFFEKAPGLLR